MSIIEPKRKKWDQKYYTIHHDEILKREQEWRKTHTEATKAYREQNREKLTQQKREWRRKHRKEVLEAKKRYYERHKEQWVNYRRKRREERNSWQRQNYSLAEIHPKMLARSKAKYHVSIPPDAKCVLSHLGSCSGKLQRHHPDYSDPLRLEFLCQKHHYALKKQSD